MKFVINQIKNFIWYDNFKKSNKKLFTSVYNQKKFKKSEILIEFNGFQTSHVPLSYLSNVLARKYKAEINAFYNYSLISSPLRNTFFNEIKWNIGNFFSLKNFGIYRSFCVNKILKPKIDKYFEIKIENHFNSI